MYTILDLRVELHDGAVSRVHCSVGKPKEVVLFTVRWSHVIEASVMMTWDIRTFGLSQRFKLIYMPNTFPQVYLPHILLLLIGCVMAAPYPIAPNPQHVIDLAHGHFAYRIMCVCLARPGGGSASWPESVRPTAKRLL